MLQNDILKTILSPTYIQEVIKNQYKLNSIDNTILIRSSGNDIYKIITKDAQYIFKVFNLDKKLKDLEFEIEYMLYLNSNHILVTHPYKTFNNKYFIYVDYPEGEKIAILTNYIEGDKLKYTSEDSYLLGKNIAKIHKISNFFNIHIDKHKAYNILEIFIEKKLIVKAFLKKYYPESIEFFSYFSNMLLSSLKNIKFTQQYCHNDLHTDNTKRVGDNVYLYDFDFSGYGYVIYELSVFKWSCIIGNRIGIWKEFLRGYKSVLAINIQELKYLLYFVAIRDIMVMSFYINRIDIIGHKSIDDSYVNKRINFLKSINKQITKRS